MATLTQEEIDQCRTVFHKFNNNKKKFDKDGECIDLWIAERIGGDGAVSHGGRGVQYDH